MTRQEGRRMVRRSCGMKSLGLALMVIGSSIMGAVGNTARSDSFYEDGVDTTNTMWVFGKYGVDVYTLDGRHRLHRIQSKDICSSSEDGLCNFGDAVADGLDHVWATNSKGGDYLDVFHIATGKFVGAIPTCERPTTMDHAPFRDALFVHCEKHTDNSLGRVLVYNTHRVDVAHRQVQLDNPADENGASRFVLDPSSPNTAFVTLMEEPYIQYIDLNLDVVRTRVVFPDVFGLGPASYSPENKHIYVRPSVCCHCGQNGDTRADCGEDATNVKITTGPFAGQTRPGYCGERCYGTPADTIGVIETDSHNSTFLHYHRPPLGFGATPYTTPDGELTLLVANDGGQKVTILRDRGFRASSEVAGYIDLNFSKELGRKAVYSVCFVTERRGRDFVIFSSAVSSKVVVVDIHPYRSPIVYNTTLDMKEIELETNQGGAGDPSRTSKREVIWAAGTDYVWVQTVKYDELHVLKLDPDGDVSKTKVVQSLKDVVSQKVVYVNRYNVPEPALSPPNSGTSPKLTEDQILSLVDDAVIVEVAKVLAERAPPLVADALGDVIAEEVTKELDEDLDAEILDTVDAVYSSEEDEIRKRVRKAVEMAYDEKIVPELEKQPAEGTPNSAPAAPPTEVNQAAVLVTEGGTNEEEDEQADTLAVAAIVLSVLAILIGSVNCYTVKTAGGGGPCGRRSEVESMSHVETAPHMMDMDAIDLQ